MQQHVSSATDLKSRNTAKCDFNDVGIRAGGNDKVMLKPPLVAVIDHIDAPVDLRVSNASEIGNAGSPGRWIRSGKVVTFGRQLIESFDLGSRVGARQFQPHDRTWRHRFLASGLEIVLTYIAILLTLPVSGRIVEGHYRFGRGQEKNVTIAARDKLGTLMSLALVEFEIEWQSFINAVWFSLRYSIFNREDSNAQGARGVNQGRR